MLMNEGNPRNDPAQNPRDPSVTPPSPTPDPAQSPGDPSVTPTNPGNTPLR